MLSHYQPKQTTSWTVTARYEEDVVPQEVIGELPGAVQKFLRFEQQNLWKKERFRNPGSDFSLQPEFLPEHGRAFWLPCFWVKKKHLYVYGGWAGAASAIAWAEGEGPEARVLFPIHPAELDSCGEFLAKAGAVDTRAEGLAIVATPTSSTRTVLAWPVQQPGNVFLAKLSLRSKLFGNRRLQRSKVARCVGLSELVERSRRALPTRLRYFTEPYGLVPRQMADMGVIIRPIPEEVRSDRVVPVALFALMGGTDASRPLLLELPERTGIRVQEFVEDVLLEGFAKIWIELVFGRGIVLEAHAQDLLVAVSKDGVPLEGLYYRDFEGLTVDWALRRARGVLEPISLPYCCDWFNTYETWGYPRYQLASWKMRISLFDYVFLVLGELQSALTGWQASGVMAGPKLSDGELTSLFSRYLRCAIQERFGMREEHEYDISRDLNRFIKFMMCVRREVMHRNRSPGWGDREHAQSWESSR